MESICPADGQSGPLRGSLGGHGAMWSTLLCCCCLGPGPGPVYSATMMIGRCPTNVQAGQRSLPAPKATGTQRCVAKPRAPVGHGILTSPAPAHGSVAHQARRVHCAVTAGSAVASKPQVSVYVNCSLNRRVSRQQALHAAMPGCIGGVLLPAETAVVVLIIPCRRPRRRWSRWTPCERWR